MRNARGRGHAYYDQKTNRDGFEKEMWNKHLQNPVLTCGRMGGRGLLDGSREQKMNLACFFSSYVDL